jgi:DNA-binding transcriptional MerR regulator
VTATGLPLAEEPGILRRAAKSPAAFRTTGEVADELDLPTHVLRFWESKFPQVKPLKRGGGRRYYRPEDVELLRRIRQCLHQQGYTIRGVQKLLRDGALPGDEPAPRPLGKEPRFALLPPGLPPGFPPAAQPEMAAGPAAAPQGLRAALEEVRRELLEIRGLLGKLRAGSPAEPV